MPIIKNNKLLLKEIESWKNDKKTKIDNLTKTRDESVQIINAVEDERDRQLLYKRYAEGKPWHIVAEEMCYSEGHIKRLHKQIMKKFIARN